MKKKKAKEIFERVKAEWIRRHNKDDLDPAKLEAVRQIIEMSPHDDGIMPVTLMENGKTHLVPIEDIILNGLQGNDLNKYPIKGDTNDTGKK